MTCVPVGTDILHMVVEIPRMSTAKMEISTKLDKNPIKQDIKNGCVCGHIYEVRIL